MKEFKIMENWPAWSAPLLGAGGGMLAGAALVGDPGFPYPPLYAVLGGMALGMFAGLIVWAGNYRKSQPMENTRDRPLPHKEGVVSRWIGLGFLTAGLTCLGINHALVVLVQKKLFYLILGGAFFLGIGLIWILSPNALAAGRSGERLPVWVHIISGLLVMGSLGLGLYLWIVVYK